MEYKQSTPSILARLMGLDELPPSHPVQKKQRVLSDDYLRRVASIGAREKLVGRRSFRIYGDEQKECVDVFRLLSASKRVKLNGNSVTKRGVQFSSEAAVRDKSAEGKLVSPDKYRSSSKLDVDLRSLSVGKLDSAATDFAPPAGSLKASHSEVRKHKGVVSQQIKNLETNSMQSSPRSRSRFSKEKRRKMGSVSSATSQSKVMGLKVSAENSNSRVSPSHNSTNIKNTFSSDGKKQILERWRTTKKYEQVELSSKRKSRREVLPVDDDEPNTNPTGTCIPDHWKDGQEISITVLTAENDTEEQRTSAKDDHPVLSLNISAQQDKANTGFEEESVTPYYFGMDPESPISLEEIYQPSPNSVLGPFYIDEMIASPECFKSVGDSLHGLQMQLELLKSETSDTYSEGSSMIVSSDDDIAKVSIGEPEENEVILQPFEVEECRDFSFLVDVLSEARLHSKNLKTCIETWHSHEGPISLSVYETLEKKYGEQISWKRSDRRLLFDRINLGLTEILPPAMGVPEWRKPVAGRFSSKNGEALIEEELSALLVRQEKEALKNTELVLGKEEKLLDLIEDIQDIGREIENSLIDELVAEVVSMDSF